MDLYSVCSCWQDFFHVQNGWYLWIYELTYSKRDVAQTFNPSTCSEIDIDLNFFLYF